MEDMDKSSRLSSIISTWTVMDVLSAFRAASFRHGGTMLKVAATIALLGFATSSSAQIPQISQGRFSAMLYGLDWEPGFTCRPPNARSEVATGGSAGMMRAVDRWERCVRDQADNDMRFAVQVVRDGRDKALADGMEEMSRSLERGY